MRLEHGGHGDFAVSQDGRRLVVVAPGRYVHLGLHLIRPETGATELLFDAPDGQVVWPPVLSPNGESYAFTKHTGGASLHGPGLGIWAGQIGGGPPVRIVAPSGDIPVQPFGWSPDGRWLAFARWSPAPSIWLVSPDGEKEIRVGEGHEAAWMPREPRLLVARGSGRGATPPHALLAYDTVTGATREVARADNPISALATAPDGLRFSYIERVPGRDLLSPGTVWIRRLDGSVQRTVAGQRVGDLAWSSDGRSLTGQVGGDDSTVPVIDVTRQPPDGLGSVCRRGGLPPPWGSGCT